MLLTGRLAEPGHWFAFDFTNRPLQYWIGAVCQQLEPGDAGWRLTGEILAAMNAAALFCLYACTKRLLASPALRLATVAFAAFLPVTLTVSTVYAADATAQLPFFAGLWLLLVALEPGDARRTLRCASLAGLVLSLAHFAKFTFLFVPAGVATAFLLSWRCGRIAGRTAATVVAFGAGLPTATGLAINFAADRQLAAENPRHVFNWKGTGEMTWASLLRPKASDARIFYAPGYWDTPATGTSKHPLLVNNDFSYPALLHLGTFTDVLGVTNFASTVQTPERPQRQQRFAQAAVAAGLPFTLSAFFATLVFGLRATGALLQPRWLPAPEVVLVGAMSCAWYAPVVGALPYVERVYEWGYWLPRLVLPALWGFAMLLFRASEAAGTRTAWTICGAVLVQAAVHAAGVWY